MTGGRANADDSTPAAKVKSLGGSPRRRRGAAAKDDGHVAQALRTAYQRTVDENIPAEMLDLLSKLD